MKSIVLPEESTDESKENGWTLDYNYLCAVLEIAQSNGANVSQEDVEAVLLAAQDHANKQI